MYPMKYLLVAALGLGLGLTPALAATEQAFTPAAFEAAQKEGKVILVDVTAPWCPTCTVQKSILEKLSVSVREVYESFESVTAGGLKSLNRL